MFLFFYLKRIISILFLTYSFYVYFFVKAMVSSSLSPHHIIKLSIYYMSWDVWYYTKLSKKFIKKLYITMCDIYTNDITPVIEGFPIDQLLTRYILIAISILIFFNLFYNIISALRHYIMSRVINNISPQTSNLNFTNDYTIRIFCYLFIYLLLCLYAPYNISVPIILLSYVIISHAKVFGQIQTFVLFNIFLTFLFIFYPFILLPKIDTNDCIILLYLASSFFTYIILSKNVIKIKFLFSILLYTFSIIFFLYTLNDVFMCLNTIFIFYLLYFVVLKTTHKQRNTLLLQINQSYRLLHYKVFSIVLLSILFIFVAYHIMFLCGVSSTNNFLIYSTRQVK